ncbi:iron-hydroxamate ABC transporter substrate-binding protein [Paenibacillus sp. MBLB4367]|uniref:iron-hydroxamate ABC transporter substrate-binding protein n=1 Tax=Paenibacillus sp. MBLB4367 TaxID=3384767 RepID=UPI00390812A7
MNKRVLALGIASILMLGLAACGAKEEAKPVSGASASPKSAGTSPSPSASPSVSPSAASTAPRSISYLGKSYTVPGQTDKIVISGSLESMEDALVLGVKPLGAITVGGKFPSLFDKITDGVTGVGEKTQPSLETILKLKPDIILSSTKFPAETAEKFAKIATTIPVSHISTDWEANLNLLAELTGKQEQAKKALQTYKDDLKAVKEKIAPVIKEKEVLAVRVRTGNLFVYPEDVFFNPSLYAELGATVPAEVKQAKAQQQISMEKLTEINPDYLFIQFSEDENKDTPKALDDLKNNPIFKSVNAVKNGNLYVNLVDPLTQGGTAYSKIAFLDALKKITFNQAK